MTYRNTIVFLAVGCAFIAGTFLNIDNAWVVEIAFISAALFGGLAGYWIGTNTVDRDSEERAATISRHFEHHPSTYIPPFATRNDYQRDMRYPIVTRGGDPEEDHRPIPIHRDRRYPKR